MFKKLEAVKSFSIAFWRAMRQPSEEPVRIQTNEDEQTQSSYCVFLWGPEYDTVTSYTSKWLHTLDVPEESIHYKSIGPNVSKKEIEKALEAIRTLPRVKIFFGHGSRDALLGPPQENEAKTPSGRHSIIYNIDMIERDPGALFAFCCEAGIDLGKRFCATGQRSFLGYTRKVPLLLANEGCIETWKYIVLTVSQKIIADKGITFEHEVFLKQLYEDRIEFFSQGLGTSNDKAFLMTIYLQEHIDMLCRY